MLRRALHAIARLAWFGILAGCASVPPAVENRPLDEPGAPQAIAIVAPVLNLTAGFTGPASSEALAKGALGGAAGGASLPLLVGVHVWPLLLLPPFWAVTGAFAAAGAVIGAASGTSTVVPPQEVAAIEQMIARAVADVSLPALTAKAAAIDVARFTPYGAEVIDEDAAPGPADKLPYFRMLRARGFGGVLYIRVTGVGFAGRGGSDPGIRLFMIAQAEFIDTATAKPTALRGLVYLSPPHEQPAWTSDDGALAKAELERGYRTLAERVVEDLVLQADAYVGSNMAGPLTCGVEPTKPKLEWEGVLFGARHLSTPAVQSLKPVLGWQAMPTPVTGADETRWTKVKAGDIRYDLRIWKAVDDAPADIVYEREDLERPEHEVELALEPRSMYFWSVRVRYRVDGEPRATRWSAANVPAFVPPVPLESALYYSRIEGETANPIPCTTRDLTPCGCLDFIPRQNFYRFRTP